MHIQSIPRPTGAPLRFHAPSLLRTKPQLSAPSPQPEPKGLSRAQLREIIIEQLG
jgi:hypothetical protein